VSRKLWIGLVVLALGLIAPLQAALVTGTATVSGAAIIWGAGNTSTAPDGQAVLPPSITFDLSATSISFSIFSGTVKSADGAAPNGTDGQAGVISGNQFDTSQFFLVGVFLGPDEATGSAPATLTYSGTSSDASLLSPSLGQVFFIADGQGSAGQQTFNIPTGATRLYWGFVDGAGSSATAYEVERAACLPVNTPEPSSIVLMGLGIAALTLLRRRRAS
jgi:hypothetical protein